MPVIEVNDPVAFRNQLIQSKKIGQLIVVDYYATWCGPCKAIAPAIESMSAKLSHIVFMKVDVDKQAELAREAGVTAMPTFGFWVDGKLVDTVKGADTRAIEEKCAKYGKPVKTSAFTGAGHTLGGPSSQSTPAASTTAAGSAPARRNPWADPNFVPGGKKPAASSSSSLSSSSSSQPSSAAPAKPAQAAQPVKPATTAAPAASAAPVAAPAAQPSQSAAQSTTSATTPPSTQSGRVHDSKLKVDDVMLAELLSMGFTQVRAEKSLILTQNKSADAALEWLMEHQEDADIDEPLQVVGSKTTGRNLDDMDEDERLIYEDMMKKRAASQPASSSSSTSSSSSGVFSGAKPVAEMTSAEKMAWLAAKRAEVKAKREQEALDKVKNDFKSQKGMTSALNDLKEQREEAERKAAMDRKKKEQADKAKQRNEIAARLAADKERRRLEQQRTMEALAKAKAAKEAGAK